MHTEALCGNHACTQTHGTYACTLDLRGCEQPHAPALPHHPALQPEVFERDRRLVIILIRPVFCSALAPSADAAGALTRFRFPFALRYRIPHGESTAGTATLRLGFQ